MKSLETQYIDDKDHFLSSIDPNRYKKFHFTCRLVIANGNLESGRAKHMQDITITVTDNATVNIKYKGLDMGYYGNFTKLSEFRSNLDKILKESWFIEELKSN